MGMYLNPGCDGMRRSIRSEIFIDKSELIAYTNKVLDTEQQSICVSRPRRFGKSMAAKMLSAYYDRSVDSRYLFDHLKIASYDSFDEYRNKFNVIFLNMQDFVPLSGSVDDMIESLKEAVINDLEEVYPEVVAKSKRMFLNCFNRIYTSSGDGFVIILDEWDCIFRLLPDDEDGHKKYLDFLRTWLKDKDYVKLAYMTGILPIKKYGIHSALNMFEEFSMTDPSVLAQYFGFTQSEVEGLCEQYQMDLTEVKAWYDGYKLDSELHIYSPKSVVDAMRKRKLGHYWNNTETYEAIRPYLDMNYDGLKDSVIRMLAGESIPINTQTFQNDMRNFSRKDDVLTLLVHLGYLSYDGESHAVSIPNEEIRQEYLNAIEVSDWREVVNAVNASESLLKAAWAGDAESVVKGIDAVHMENTSVLQYNNENALSCVITLAFYSARNYYVMYRELPAGKGFADIVFVPRNIHADKPAMVIELKWDQDVETAIDQIKQKQYTKSLEQYSGDVLLVGISYDKKSKLHSCVIETYRK